MEDGNRDVKYATSFREQFTARGVVIGCIGTVVLTMSSMYVALRLGALPWPIIFVALISMFFLKALGKTNINEINVTHTIMSAGAMVAGGVAFTLPGIYMLNPDATLKFLPVLVVVLGGTILGLIFTALTRKYFVVTKELPYPMGQAAAETVLIGDEGGKKAIALFISLAAAGVFTFFRDAWALVTGKVLFAATLPATFNTPLTANYGSLFGIWLSPMLIAVGYIIGPIAIGVWFLGALIGDFGILVGGVEFGWWDGAVAAAIKSSLGIGLMVGTGFGILFKGIIPKAKEIFGPMFKKSALSDGVVNLRWAPFAFVILAAIFTLVADMGVIASIITILGVWLTTSMSAQVVGQSGINPMEIFGIIVLLAAKAASSALGDTETFFVAAIVAVACGLVGDVMNDFKAGYILKSDPKAQWIGEFIGGVIGAFVAVAIFMFFIQAYGANAFGPEGQFPAPQAAAVAAMVGGIPNITAFIVGLVAGCVLYFTKFPVMTLGLGVYLPFYLSATAFIGGLLKFIVERAAPDWNKKGSGLIIASGLLGGEAVVGVVIAIVQAVQGFTSLG